MTVFGDMKRLWRALEALRASCGYSPLEEPLRSPLLGAAASSRRLDRWALPSVSLRRVASQAAGHGGLGSYAAQRSPRASGANTPVLGTARMGSSGSGLGAADGSGPAAPGESTVEEPLVASWSTGDVMARLWDASLEKWSNSWSKLLFSCVYLALAVLLTSTTMVFVHERVPDTATYPPLPDIVLDNLELIPMAFEIVELCILLLGAIFASLVFFHRHRAVVLRRWNAIVGTCFLLRCVTMYITSLSVPGTHLDCHPTQLSSVEEKLTRAWQIATGLGMTLNGVHTCGDYMFSGHTVVLTSFNYFINEYSPASWRGLRLVSWALNVFGMFMILASHEHYSLDVFMAFYITSRLFVHYHSIANVLYLTHDGGTGTGSRAQPHDLLGAEEGFFPFESYLEEYATGVLPNEYEWPWQTCARCLTEIRARYRRSFSRSSRSAQSSLPASGRGRSRRVRGSSRSRTGDTDANTDADTDTDRSASRGPAGRGQEARQSASEGTPERKLAHLRLQPAANSSSSDMSPVDSPRVSSGSSSGSALARDLTRLGLDLGSGPNPGNSKRRRRKVKAK